MRSRAARSIRLARRDRGRLARRVAQLRLLAHRPGRQEPPGRRPAPAPRHIGKGWEHVHFAERRDGDLRQPAPGRRHRPVRRPHRADASPRSPSPAGTSSPTRTTRPIRASPARGRTAGHPGADPLRVGGGPWRTAVDFRNAMLARSEFGRVYTPATRQNHKGEPGCFSFYLARGFSRPATPPSRSARATCPATRRSSSVPVGAEVVISTSSRPARRRLARTRPAGPVGGRRRSAGRCPTGRGRACSRSPRPRPGRPSASARLGEHSGVRVSDRTSRR